MCHCVHFRFKKIFFFLSVDLILDYGIHTETKRQKRVMKMNECEFSRETDSALNIIYVFIWHKNYREWTSNVRSGLSVYSWLSVLSVTNNRRFENEFHYTHIDLCAMHVSVMWMHTSTLVWMEQRFHKMYKSENRKKRWIE